MAKGLKGGMKMTVAIRMKAMLSDGRLSPICSNAVLLFIEHFFTLHMRLPSILLIQFLIAFPECKG